jgi:signal transduction histidine kinase
MSLSARLILLLTLTVSAVMTIASFIMLRQQETELMAAARSELRAHVLTLQIALEEDYRGGRSLDAQRLIERLSENTGILGVRLFDAQGGLTFASNSLSGNEPPLTEARQVLATGANIEQLRTVGDTEVFSVLAPISLGSQRVGALEMIQPISFVKAEIAHARRDMGLATLLVCVAIFLVVLLVMRSNLMRPVRSLVEGALTFGSGNLEHRVTIPPSSGELAVLAREFNRMANHLNTQRQVAAREAEERLELERTLRHNERLAAVGRLAAGVAHEMGAPLQVIDGRARQLLNNPEALLETRQRNLTIIRSQSEQIARIVRQLLNLARPYNLNLTNVDLHLLLTETLESLEPTAVQFDIQFQIPSSDGIFVRADSGLLHQVFMNLCLNAVQAISTTRRDGGKLRIEFVPDAVCRDNSRFTAVRVIDNGGGIAPENFTPLFDPFFTTREIGKGTGLGLPVSRRIVEEHGGWIEATNNDEGGATFTVYLPQSHNLPGREPDLINKETQSVYERSSADS